MSLLNKLLKPVLNWFIIKQAKQNLPNYNDSLICSAIEGHVEIIRDKWAVPHIYAENQSDLFFAQGFVHAQDRLWQMELTRRVVSGRVSEIVGVDALDVDRLTRILGFKALGEKDVLRFKENALFPIIESYVNGINFFIENCPHLPVEFKLLKFKPELWSIADCFGMSRLLAMQMSQGFLHELERMGLVDKFGLEKASEIFPEYPTSNPVSLMFGNETNRIIDGKLEAFKGPYLQSLGGSNNWVVAPHKMEHGAAALCNDPHLLIGTPNIWYENHLITPDYENTGVSIPGVPLVLIGHNRNIAWGATLTYADIQDTFIEKFTGPNCLQYRYGDRILKSVVHEETIKIKGRITPHIEKVIQTHHGPVIMAIDDTTKISLCSNALNDNEMIIGFYDLNMAKGWDDFVGACSKLTIPSLNLVYADTDNNIGYFMTGEVPIRSQNKGLIPSNGFDAQQEWTGRVPFSEMPHVFNPDQGYFYTCNNKIVGDDYPYDLGNIWMNGYRAKRLEALLNSKEKFNFDDFANWQLDFYCEPGLQFAAYLNDLKNNLALEQLAGRVKTTADLLIDWDGFLTADCIGGTIYQVLKQQLIDLIFVKSNTIRGKVTNTEISIFDITEFFGHDTTTILKLLNNPRSCWWEVTPQQTLILALVNTEAFLTTNVGADFNSWKWGKLHKIKSKHALGVKKPLDEIFDIGNVAIGGDTDTLCQVAFLPGKHYGGSMVAASYRQLIDMGDFSNSKCIAPIGQSGNLESPHYQDQFDMWIKGEYKPMIWSKEQLENYTLYKTSLRPE
ncbi:MAG: penicillin acylase family protein [Saprospiraceae bacterium]|nr:penicillin acylase family protein [Saprospiraceae bacterium]